MSVRKGIILAGGKGARLSPLTFAVSKQLLPVYDKPMVYYPLSVLMLTGIRDIAVITDPQETPAYERLLGDGSNWGVNFTFIEQETPDGLVQGITLSERFIDGHPIALILGDNIFYGGSFRRLLISSDAQDIGSSIFVHKVADPQNYGVVQFGDHEEVIDFVEKPKLVPSEFAVTGLYFFDKTAVKRARKIKKSSRGEYEITDLLKSYMHDKQVNVQKMGRGYAWLDAGTHEGLINAGNLVRTLQQRQGLLIGSPDEVAYLNGWISGDALLSRVKFSSESEYGQNLAALIEGR